MTEEGTLQDVARSACASRNPLFAFALVAPFSLTATFPDSPVPAEAYVADGAWFWTMDLVTRMKITVMPVPFPRHNDQEAP